MLTAEGIDVNRKCVAEAKVPTFLLTSEEAIIYVRAH